MDKVTYVTLQAAGAFTRQRHDCVRSVVGTPMISVTNLRKSFKDTQVLRDVSFTVDKGSIFALLGFNGAGKTTLINILTTLLKADGGSAYCRWARCCKAAKRDS